MPPIKTLELLLEKGMVRIFGQITVQNSPERGWLEGVKGCRTRSITGANLKDMGTCLHSSSSSLVTWGTS